GIMQTLEVGGLVVDGAIRDLIDIKKLNFPVFSKGTTVSSGTKTGPGEINVRISCGGTSVNTGAIVVGVVDGIVVIQRGQDKVVLEKAHKKEAGDEKREDTYGKNKETNYEYLDGMIAKNR